MSRLSRKEVKRDEVLETVGSAVHYARDHVRTILLAIVALVVGVLAYAGYSAWSSGRAERANGALAEALAITEAELDPYEPKPEGVPPTFADEAARDAQARQALEGVRNDFSSSRPADVATAYLAGMAARAGELDRARELWGSLVDGSADHLLKAEARVNLMALDRQQGQLAELADRLRAELDAPESSLPPAVLLQQLAMTLEELGQSEEAREVYLRLATEYPASAYAGGAQRRADLL
jgi:tetratricopeptide (TPR) repeat protein